MFSFKSLNKQLRGDIIKNELIIELIINFCDCRVFQVNKSLHCLSVNKAGEKMSHLTNEITCLLQSMILLPGSVISLLGNYLSCHDYKITNP